MGNYVDNLGKMIEFTGTPYFSRCLSTWLSTGFSFIFQTFKYVFQYFSRTHYIYNNNFFIFIPDKEVGKLGEKLWN